MMRAAKTRQTIKLDFDPTATTLSVLTTLTTRARNAVERAVAAGTLVPEPCEQCGETEKTEAHHPDYTRPLDIVWLCRTCHRQLHIAYKAAVLDGVKGRDTGAEVRKHREGGEV